MEALVVAILVIFSAYGIYFFVSDWQFRLWRWLKGSRRSYYLSTDGNTYGKYVWTDLNIRSLDDRRRICEPTFPILEINQGLFRRASSVYPDVFDKTRLNHWQVANTNGYDSVYLKDTQGISPELACEIIGRYRSLQAMFDRIAKYEQQVGKLEDKLAWTESHRKTWLASLEALRQEIESDRQRYRSQAAQKIRTRVEQVLEHARGLGQVPDEDSVDAIKRLWMVSDGKVPPLRKCGGRVWDLSLKI